MGGATAVPPSSTPLEQESADIENVSRVEKADFQAEKVLSSEGKAVGEGEGADVGAEAGEEATAGVLDAIPGADVIGLIVGAGVVIGSLIKKPHEHLPVDKINASFQAGIG